MFSDGDIICFLGDSITANGLVCAEVYQTVGKKKRIKCFNCGVSGGDAKNASDYIYAHCLIRNPSYVVVNFGINDVGLSLYYPSCELEDKEERRAYAKEVLANLPSTSCNLGLLADYIENGDFREELVEAVVKKSIFVKE